MKNAAVTMLLCMFAIEAFGQDEPPERAAVFAPSFSFSAGRDTQSIAGGGDISDTVFLFAPSVLGVRKFSARTQFSAFYRPEFEMYSRYSELNSWNHDARVYLSHKATPRLSYDLGESLVVTSDPSRELANSFLLLPHSRYEENSFYLNVDYALGPHTTWSARVDDTVTRFGLGAQQQIGFLDQWANAFSTSLGHQFGPTRRATVTYSLLRLDLLDSNSLAGRTVLPTPYTHFLTFGYHQSFSPDFGFGISGGLTHANGFSYIVSGVIDRRFGPVLMDAGYNRSIAFYGNPALQSVPALDPRFANGLLASNLYQMASFGLRSRFMHGFAITVRATGAKNTERVLHIQNHSYMALARVDYKLSDRVVLFSTAELYGQNLNAIPGVPTRRTRFFGGVQIGLFPSVHPAEMFPMPGPSGAFPSANTQATTEVK